MPAFAAKLRKAMGNSGSTKGTQDSARKLVRSGVADRCVSHTRTDMGNIWGPKQRISVQEAIRIATVNGAYTSFEGKLKGTIKAES